MSIIAHSKSVEDSDHRRPSELRRRSPSTVLAIVSFCARPMVGSARLFVRTMQAVIAEARMHKAAIEVELYRNRYKHSSKNDDDLPIVR